MIRTKILSLAVQELWRGYTAGNSLNLTDANHLCRCVLETLQYTGHTSLLRYTPE